MMIEKTDVKKQYTFMCILFLTMIVIFLSSWTKYTYDVAAFTQFLNPPFIWNVTNNGRLTYVDESTEIMTTKVLPISPKIGSQVILAWTHNYLTREIGPINLIHYDCGDYQCDLTRNRKYLKQSHVVLFNSRASKASDLPATKEPWQRWVLQTAESPVHENIPTFFNGKANWTFTYHSKSDISCVYGFYVPHGKYDQGPYYIPNGHVRDKYLTELNASANHYKVMEKTLLRRKEKGVLWMVSNCGPTARKKYAKELERNGLAIDKFGKCGKSDPCKRDLSCLKKMMAKYKFYLAFENSKCEDYITEKTWKCLDGGMVPIVMGPSIENYKKKLPPNSFIHVDNFTSPSELVKYINYLTINNEAYYKYHAWRKDYDTFSIWNHRFLWICDMCKKIQDPPNIAYNTISYWWKPNVQCNNTVSK